jgi:hypothetical protein
MAAIYHYSRFSGIVNRIWKYPYAVDIGILLTTITVNILYLLVTLVVEFCTGPGKDLMSPTCEYSLDPSHVYLLY